VALLPTTVVAERYFPDLHGQPLAFWRAALTALAARHGLPDGPWERAALGRNIVFLGPTAVVKLGPPCWPGDMAREADALEHVAGRLPVATPAVLAHGSLESWEYLITSRCHGVNLHTLWRELGPRARAGLARQHGALMAAVHGLPVALLPPALAFDWARMLAGQRADLERSLARSGVDTELVRRAAAYVAAADALGAPVETTALVHGDLTHLNLLVAQGDDGWSIVGLLDWGDVKIGPWTHELISPAVHMYLGDRDALAAWYQGYGRLPAGAAATVAHLATARAMLYYADEFAPILQRLPGGAGCRDWPAVARCLWQLEDR
jgi:hygromycin-B 7''-O-kinase